MEYSSLLHQNAETLTLCDHVTSLGIFLIENGSVLKFLSNTALLSGYNLKAGEVEISAYGMARAMI